MAFKVNNPLKYTDPGKKLPKNPYPGNTTPGLENVKSYKIPSFLGIENTPDKDRDTVKRFGGSGVNSPYSSDARKRLNILNSASTTVSNKPAPLNPSLPIEGPKQEVKFDTGFGDSGKKVIKDDTKKQKTIVPPPKKTGGYVKKGGTSTGNIKDYKAGTEARRNEYTARGWKQDSTTKINKDSTTPKKPTAEVIKTKGVSIGVKAPKASDVKLSQKPTVKAAPKDNSRKAIKARKTADKKAGVSKSQMRANKAKSKSEAASAKAKKSKNPSYRAQLTAKSERLAKRAARKGGSPAKLEDPKQRTHAQILKAYPGAVKVPGKINTYKYKGTTLKPALFPVKKKAKTVKQAIEIKEKK